MAAVSTGGEARSAVIFAALGVKSSSRRRMSAMRSLVNFTRIRSVTSILGHDLLSGIFRSSPTCRDTWP